MALDLRALTPQQRAVFAHVSHYYETLGEATPAAYVARKMALTHERIRAYFRILNDLGWLRAAGSPAIPTRRLPPHEGALERIQLSGDDEGRHAGESRMAKRQTTQSAPPAGQPRTIEMPMLSRVAEVFAKSLNDEARTVDLIFTTGAPVQRYDWMSGKRYLEVLSMDPAHVRLERLNTIGPLLDSHSSYSVADQLGTVVPNSVTLTKKDARATVRFSKRAAVEPIWGDVRDGIIRSVSVGYKVYKFSEDASGDNALPVRTAIDWEPYEVSMVSMPADAGAKVRGDQANTNPCVLVTRSESVQPKETVMREETQSETIVEDDPLNEPTGRTVVKDPPDETTVATRIERERAQGILGGCRAARLSQAFADGLIAEGVTLVVAQTRILAELAKRGGDDRGPARGPSGAADVVVGDDPFVHKRKGIENALLHRAMPRVPETKASPAYGFELSDEGRQYRGLGLMDIADLCLRARGVRITGMQKKERASAALSMRAGGLHTVSDFPNILADVMNKVLRAAYEAAPPTWGPIAKDVPLADFKPTKQLQLGDAPQLLEVLEHGEFTSGTIAEGKEQFQLKTYGRIFAITRQAIINDDLNAFADIPSAFGRMARTKESDLAWAEITANAAMGDGVVLFHATHANLDTVAAAIAVAPIGKGRAAMRLQKGLDLVTLLNLNPSYLIVPAAIETVADQFVSNSLMASAPGSINPFAGRLQVISEPRLDANSVTAWYLATAVSQCPVLFHGTLDGQSGPEVTQEQGFDVDGVRMKCRMDVAFKSADFHGIWKNPGV